MTEKQYQILLELYHEYNEAFECLSAEIKTKYYNLLYHQAHYKPYVSTVGDQA